MVSCYYFNCFQWLQISLDLWVQSGEGMATLKHAGQQELRLPPLWKFRFNTRSFICASMTDLCLREYLGEPGMYSVLPFLWCEFVPQSEKEKPLTYTYTMNLVPLTLKVFFIYRPSTRAEYMPGNDLASVHAEVKRCMMSRLGGSSWFGVCRQQHTGNAYSSCVTVHVSV